MLKRSVHSLLIAALSVATPAVSLAATYKCTIKDGKVVYQDAPCSTAATSGEKIRTWENSTTAGADFRVKPNERLEGPPQALYLINLYRRWIDAERLATNTPRISLAGPAAALQALHRDVEATDVVKCMADAKAALLLLTRTSSEAFVGFMGKEPTELPYHVIDRPKLIRGFEAEVARARCK